MISEIASDFIVNPYTGRLIKKHSKTYERLVNAHLLNEDRPSTSEENMILKAQNNEEAKTIRMKLNKNLQKNKIKKMIQLKLVDNNSIQRPKKRSQSVRKN